VNKTIMPGRSVSFAAAAEDDGGNDAAGATPTPEAPEIQAAVKAAKAAQFRNKGPACPNCGSHAIEQHGASGASVCTDCGVVVEENAIVSSVEFAEGAGGASSMIGQFVSATSSKAYTGPAAGGAVRGGRYGFSRDSRETTLANGRRRIQEVASRLRLGTHYVDAAHRLFTIAVEKNFVQGRRTTHVVAACLYIACRQEKSQHMLIDFSDALQVNVYTLGTCFLKFRRLLGLKLEIIDPALYIYRFAAHLELDEKANAVALTALRLVGRMKRDWIVAGRRPAGICAAALLIAARAHGFSKHHQDVTRILRVCGLTVTTRVKEFEKTPSANLTLQQFNTVDFEAEADPPIFTQNKIREARAKAIQDGNLELLASGALDDPSQGKRATLWRDAGSKKKNEKHAKFQEMYSSLEKELATGSAEAKEKELATESQEEAADETTAIVTATPEQTEEEAEQETEKPAAVPEGQLVVHEGADQPVVVSKKWEQAYPKTKFGKALVLPDHATEEERQASSVPTEAKISLSEWKEEMPDSIDLEIDNMFRDDDEIAQREAIFNKINKDYIEKQARKEQDILNADKKDVDLVKEDTTQADAHARYTSNRNRKNRRDGEEPTTEEQLMAAVSNRKISRKINYDALSSIFDDDGGFSTDAVEDAPAAEDPDAMYGSL
jgi:transcription factor IIIB subunit 2